MGLGRLDRFVAGETYPSRLLLILAVLTAWRLAAAWHRDLELYADEAQYWTWSLAPDWGYYSKPPMVAWLIRLGTGLFGDAEMGVRAATFLIWPLTAWLLFLLVRRLFRDHPAGEQAGFWAGLAFATLPMTSLGSWLITTDGPLLLFWCLSLYLLLRALDSNAWRDWLLAGAAAGLGLLSKYSMVFFVPSLLVYLLLSPVHRRLLWSPKPYAAAGVSLLLLAPNLWWNASHQFVSLQHTAEISQLDRAWLNPEALLDFILAQFAVFGPVLAFGLLALAVRPRTWVNDDRLRFLAAFCLVPLAAFCGLALLSRAFANWAAFAYVAGAALVAVVWAFRGRRRLLAAALAVNLLIGAVGYHYHDLARTFGVELTRKTDPYTRLTGYRELGRQVAGLLETYPDARLLGYERKALAALIYYARPRSLDYVSYNPSGRIDDHYGLTADIKERPQGRFVLVSRHLTTEAIAHSFAEVLPLADLHVPVHRDHALHYKAWLVRDFTGY